MIVPAVVTVFVSLCVLCTIYSLKESHGLSPDSYHSTFKISYEWTKFKRTPMQCFILNTENWKFRTDATVRAAALSSSR
jgi:hypothetical protein